VCSCLFFIRMYLMILASNWLSRIPLILRILRRHLSFKMAEHRS
jgi:cadmium resistance protein CadD (predicted permease)